MSFLQKGWFCEKIERVPLKKPRQICRPEAVKFILSEVKKNLTFSEISLV